ncbi:DUF1570 domain-containing protein [Adhaeretor mobilis]|nr:DUF1570 domain-containing protein [Adhaeretor mobilis]
MKPLSLTLLVCALLVHLTSGAMVSAIERVETRGNVHEQILSGRVLVEAADGGLLLESPNQELHLIEPTEIAKRSQDKTPYKRLDGDELAEELLAELPLGFQVHQSKNYTIAFNTTRSYAKWCSSLLERLNKGFLGYWGKLDADITPPADPLVVIIFSDQQSYARYAAKELGPAVGSVIGYYSITSNRVLMYDLTGNQAIARERNSRGSMHQITAALSSPAAAPQVATIIHEATHQIAYNCGLQTRLADNPRWLSEGIALYCETPDLSSRGWRGIGKVNGPRWNQFRADYQSGKTLSLERMLTDDKLLADPQTAATAYAQAWAWNYYLIRHHRKQFVAYLEQLASKGQLVWDTPEQRLADFRKHFGEDEESLTADFYRQMSRIK